MTKQPSQVRDSLLLAEKLYAEGKYQEALDALEKVAEEPEVLRAKAQNLAMLGNTDKAIQCYESIVKLLPGDASALIELASFLTNQSRFKEAVDIYDRAIGLEPRTAGFHRDRALALRLGGSEELALGGYDAALQLDLGDGDTWAAKADLLIELHRFPEAIECLEKASAAPSRSLDAIGWTSRGSSLAREGGYDEALHCYDRALEKDPTERSAFLAKGAELQRRGDADGALACYDRMIQARPEDGRAWMEKGHILVGKRRLDEALKCYQAAVERDPSDKQSWANSGYCRRELGDNNQALSDYARAIALDSGYAYAWEGQGVCLYNLDRRGEAVSAWQRALELDPNLMWANNNIGWVLANDFKKYEESLEWYDRAIKLNPEEAQPVINKASAFIALKRASEAQALLADMLEKARAEEKGAVLVMLGSLYSDQLNDAPKALDLFEQAVAMGATEPANRLSVAEMLVRLDRHEEGRDQASRILQENAEPRLRTVAAFLVYASHALQGNLEKADGCFTTFTDRMLEWAKANPSDPKPVVTGWSYDGFLDAVLKSSASIGTKFTVLAAIDLQAGHLSAPSLARLRDSLPLIHEPPASPVPQEA